MTDQTTPAGAGEQTDLRVVATKLRDCVCWRVEQGGIPCGFCLQCLAHQAADILDALAASRGAQAPSPDYSMPQQAVLDAAHKPLYLKGLDADYRTILREERDAYKTRLADFCREYEALSVACEAAERALTDMTEERDTRRDQLIAWALVFGRIGKAVGYPDGEAPVEDIAARVVAMTEERDRAKWALDERNVTLSGYQRALAEAQRVQGEQRLLLDGALVRLLTLCERGDLEAEDAMSTRRFVNKARIALTEAQRLAQEANGATVEQFQALEQQLTEARAQVAAREALIKQAEWAAGQDNDLCPWCCEITWNAPMAPSGLVHHPRCPAFSEPGVLRP